jgi:hypothetical protein
MFVDDVDGVTVVAFATDDADDDERRGDGIADTVDMGDDDVSSIDDDGVRCSTRARIAYSSNEIV